MLFQGPRQLTFLVQLQDCTPGWRIGHIERRRVGDFGTIIFNQKIATRTDSSNQVKIVMPVAFKESGPFCVFRAVRHNWENAFPF